MKRKGGKALILARGRGRRMRQSDGRAALTEAQARAAREGWKTLMPVGGRPFLDFMLSALADAGCTDVALVIGPDQRTSFAEFESRGRTQRARIALVEQSEPRGTADAVLAAAAWAGDEPFLVVNGDNLYPTEALRALAALDGPGLAVFDRDSLIASSNIPAERIAEFALVRLTPEGDLEEIIEKPVPGREAPGLHATSGAPDLRVRRQRHLVSMNLWRFDRRIFSACRDVAPSNRGEYELPAAVQLAVARGVRFRAVHATGPVLDLSRRSDIAEVDRRLAGVEPRP